MNILDILNKINTNGFEAYLVGGYTRDKLLNKKNYDIDISTNASVDQLISLFKNIDSYNYKYGTIKIIIKPFTYEITTYRKELEYIDHRNVEIEFVTSKEEDSIRRDFTINAIYQDQLGNIFDPYNGIDDINKKIIRCIGPISKKMNEDPLRILRAIRFSTILDFTIEKELLSFIQDNPHLIRKLSKKRILDELQKILLSPNYYKGLKILKDNNYLNYMSINYDKITYVNDICAMYSQIDFIEEYPLTKKERKKNLIIKKIINDKKIEKITIFIYGLKICLLASKILNIDTSIIYNLYNDMPIKNKNQLDITPKEIHNIFDISYKKISFLYNEIIILILNKKLANNKKDIIDYISRKSGKHERTIN